MTCGDCKTCSGCPPALDDFSVRVCPTSATKAGRKPTQRSLRKHNLAGKWEADRLWTDEEIVAEASRCLFCTDAPCQTGCPAKVNVKHFVHSAAERSWYHSAAQVLAANPLGASTGWLCPACHLCQSGCNLASSAQGAIKTNQIQRAVMEIFRRFHIKPTVDPAMPAERAQTKIAVVGAGPAGLSAAVFLRRMGYTVDVFDAASRAGGLLTAELPVWRLPKGTIEWEIEMASDLGVNFHFNTALGKDFTVESLKEDGYGAVFVGVGKAEAIKAPFAVPEAAAPAVIEARDFCRAINAATRRQEAGADLPDLTGKRVIVLGAGDTAVDCAQSALRCGAATATLAFRKAISDMRADWERVNEAIAEGVELMPLAAPTDLVVENEKLAGVRFASQLRSLNGSYSATGAMAEVPADYVIVAFGSRIPSDGKAQLGLTDAANAADERVLVDAQTGFVTVIGGDVSSVSSTVVEAVNDGRTAAAAIHAAVAGKPDFAAAELPGFHSAVDDVDCSVQFLNFDIPNAFGISSAPISLSYENIARCYDAGFGFALTKTMCLTKDILPNNAYRIMKAPDMGPGDTSYSNCCMITEHTHETWCQWIRQLRQDYPDRGLVVSIMCQDVEADWREITRLVRDAGRLPDIGFKNFAVECNLSCPNRCYGDLGFDNGAMAMELGVQPDCVERVTRWVVEEAADDFPVFIKLTPNVTHIEEIAESAARAGGYISTINTVSGLPAVLYDGRPYPTIGEHGRSLISMGCSGDQIRPIALADIARCYQATEGRCILGIGGVRSAHTAIQHIQCGASAVQICSAVQRYSYDIVQEMISGIQFILYAYSRPDLRGWMSATGVARLAQGADLEWESRSHEQDTAVPRLMDRVGVTNKHLVDRAELPLPKEWFIQAKIDQDQCIGCGACASSCRDNSVAAIVKTEDGRFVVSDACWGCALCTTQCPSGALSLVRAEFHDSH